MALKRRGSEVSLHEESDEDNAVVKRPRMDWVVSVEYNFDTDGSSIVNAQLHLLESGYCSDLTITCNGQTWKVHKAILGKTCPFFKTICNGNFKESDTVTLNDDDPIGIEAMLKYLYARVSPTMQETTIAKNVVQLITADKYCLPNLVKCVKTDMENKIERHQNDKKTTEGTRQYLQCLVSNAFADEASSVWDDLKPRLARWIVQIMRLQKDRRDEMETLTSSSLPLRKQVLQASMKALYDADEKEAQHNRSGIGGYRY